MDQSIELAAAAALDEWRKSRLDNSAIGEAADGEIFVTAANFAVKYPTRLPTTGGGLVVLRMVLTDSGVHAIANSEPDGGIVAGTKEGPSTVEGATSAARRLVEDLERLGRRR